MKQSTFKILLVVVCFSSRAFANTIDNTCSNAGATATTTSEPDWDSFGFSLNGVETDKMWLDQVPVMDDGTIVTGEYSSDVSKCLTDLKPIPMHPASTVINYGQALFEGLKAFRRADGSVALFRPERNAERMRQGADRLVLPQVPIDIFVKAADAVVRANLHWVPPYGKGALYLRPLLFGSGAALGVKPSTESTFCIYASPVGNYFKGGLKAIRLQAVRGCSRAAPGGSGGVKAAGNYAPAFLTQRQVHQRGYDEALFLDALTGEAVEEAGASNFFAVFPETKTILTPTLDSETILPGVTRASIIELAEKECGYTVIAADRLTLKELRNASEAFCCGTGASITPVESVSIVEKKNPEVEVEPEILFQGAPGPITVKLYNMLLGIQRGDDEVLKEKYGHWIHIVKEADAEKDS